ncbi:apolipoprotein N-acyltransferase [Erythrobacter sp.]|uniref:apolipoprotein N-acyltransferase n=1 Tax=Erythrobacter sp. TaxID=1042 RepID=UPI001425EC6C|nr:apolipoprotein N-acyltransferase [Erythrobacter sp.]QIQ87742.1 MAG: apolipoprotein N-acyltransferase [Erythrobacter sp.]
MDNRAKALVKFAQARPGLVAFALGLVAATAYPPLRLWPVGLASLAVLVWHLQSAPDWRGAVWRGYLFGWAHLTLANNWIATAFTHQAKMPEFLGWLAVPLLCVYLAVYPALAALAAHLVARRIAPRGWGIAVFGTLFAAAWIVTEWVRSWAFTGYPWPPLGLMLLGHHDAPGIARLLPWLGTYALSGFTLLLATCLAATLAYRRWLAAGFAGVAILAAMLLSPTTSEPPREGIRYALIQPLIPQSEINDGSKFEEQFQRIARLTMPGNEESRLVLWPESAIPDYLEDGYPLRYYARMTAGADPEYARERIGRVIGADSTLLTGVVNLDIGLREDGSLGAVSARNSVLALGGDGAIEAHYAKAHLVPYGEYLPMAWALERLGLSRLTAGTIEYVAGPGPRTLDLGDHGRAGIQICYEIVFSGEVVDPDNRPDYIFNPSNDGWFGEWGPPQHLAQARMRAIEEGLPVLRSTTTGISAVIDADGIVRGHIGRGQAGRLDGFVPSAKPPTLFSRLGNALPLGWAAVLALAALVLPRLLALRRARG